MPPKFNQVGIFRERSNHIGHVARGLKSLGRIALDHPIDCCSEFRRQIGAAGADRWCVSACQSRHFFQRAAVLLARKGSVPGQEFVKRCTQAVDVGPNIDAVRVLELFGGHVVNGSHDLAGGRELVSAPTAIQQRQAEIEDLNRWWKWSSDCGVSFILRSVFRFLRPRKHQVGRFDVAMDQFVLMYVLQTERRLANQFTRLGDRERSQTPEQLRQIDPVHKLHHEEMNIVRVIGVRGADNMRMIKAANYLHLTFKSRDGIEIAQAAGVQHFDRHDTVEFCVQRLIDRTHATGPQLFQQPVTTELFETCRRGVRSVRFVCGIW
ncbi:MAG: hypothetical protein QF805_24685 [Pirellulaceae bacterium]|nr:hypothetical protein [Pirellulaceae bacterium]